MKIKSHNPRFHNYSRFFNFRLHNTEETFIAELEKVSLNVEIYEFVSITGLELEFSNNSKNSFEVIFTFNLDGNSILNKFEAQVGNRKLTSKVLEKSEAFGEYDDTISEGHGSYLIEKDGNTYKLMLGNFMGGQNFKCHMKILQPLVHNFNESTFTFPILSFSAGKIVQINGSILSKSKLETIKSNISQYFTEKKCFSITFDDNKETIPDSIIISMKYQKKTNPILWIEQHNEDKNSFASFLQYAPRFEQLTVENNLEVTFIIDNSGSMTGEKYYEAIRLLKSFLKILPPDSKFNIYGCHTDYTCTFEKSVDVSDKNIEDAIKIIGNWKLYCDKFSITPVLDYIENKKLNDTSLRVIVITDNDKNYCNNSIPYSTYISTIIFGKPTLHNIEYSNRLTDHSHIIFIDPPYSYEEIYNFFVSAISKPGKINFTVSKNEMTTPQIIDGILNGQKVNILSLFHSEIDNEKGMPKLNDLMLEVEYNGIKSKIKVSMKKFSSTLNALHVLATKKICDELIKLKRYDEEGNLIVNFEDIVVELASKHHIISDYTSMVSLNEQDITHHEQLKKVFINSPPQQVKRTESYRTSSFKRKYKKMCMNEKSVNRYVLDHQIILQSSTLNDSEFNSGEIKIPVMYDIEDLDFASDFYDNENILFIDVLIMMNLDGTWPLNFVSDFTKIDQLDIIKSNPISHNEIDIELDLDICWGTFLVLESLNEDKYCNILLWRTLNFIDNLRNKNLDIKKLKKKANKYIKSRI